MAFSRPGVVTRLRAENGGLISDTGRTTTKVGLKEAAGPAASSEPNSAVTRRTVQLSPAFSARKRVTTRLIFALYLTSRRFAGRYAAQLRCERDLMILDYWIMRFAAKLPYKITIRTPSSLSVKLTAAGGVTRARAENGRLISDTDRTTTKVGLKEAAPGAASSQPTSPVEQVRLSRAFSAPSRREKSGRKSPLEGTHFATRLNCT